MSHVVRPEILILSTRFIRYWQGCVYKFSIQRKAIQQRKKEKKKKDVNSVRFKAKKKNKDLCDSREYSLLFF